MLHKLLDGFSSLSFDGLVSRFDLKALFLAIGVTLFFILITGLFNLITDEQVYPSGKKNKNEKKSHNLDRLARYLKKHYESEFQKITRVSGFPYNADYLYLSSTILDASETPKEKGFSKNEQKFKTGRIFEDIENLQVSVKLEDIPFRYSKSLITGCAGSGRTTLSKYMAYRWASNRLWNNSFDLLIVLPLSEWHANEGLCKFILDIYVGNYEDITPESLNEIIIQRKVLIVFDGYDEVDAAKREQLACGIKETGLEHYIIVSDRPGAEGIPLDGYFKLVGFSDSDIKEYISRLCVLESRPELTLDMIVSIRQNRTIWGIVHNPLMLELVSSLWLSERLNNRNYAFLTKTAVFSNIAELILERRMIRFERSPDNMTFDRFYKYRIDIFNALGKIAFNALSERKSYFSRSLILIWLEELSPKVSLIDLQESGFLQVVDNCGIFGNEKNFSFTHISLKEYFSAYYIVESFSDEKLATFVKEFKFRTDFKGVIKFTAGLLEEKSDIFFYSLFDDPVDMAGFYQSLLHIDCLNENRFYNNAQKVENAIEAFRLWFHFGFESCNKGDDSGVFEKCLDLLSVCHLAYEEILLDFLNLLSSNENPLLRKLSVEILGYIGGSDERTLNLVMEHFEKDTDNEVKQACALTLAQISIDNSGVNLALESALSDNNNYVGFSSAIALLFLGNQSGNVVDILLEHVTDKKGSVREAAVMALCSVGATDKRVVRILFEVLNDDKDSVRNVTATVLSHLAGKSDQIVELLLSLLESDEYLMRQYAAIALGRSGRVDEEIVYALLDALTDNVEQVRKEAAVSLVTIGRKDDLDLLVSFIKNIDSFENKTNLTGLGEKLLSGLSKSEKLQKLEGSDDTSRIAAIEALGQTYGHDKKIEELFEWLLINEQNAHIRAIVATALGNFVVGNENTFKQLLDSSENDKDKTVRAKASMALAKQNVESQCNGKSEGCSFIQKELEEFCEFSKIENIKLAFNKALSEPLPVYNVDDKIFSVDINGEKIMVTGKKNIDEVKRVFSKFAV